MFIFVREKRPCLPRFERSLGFFITSWKVLSSRFLFIKSFAFLSPFLSINFRDNLPPLLSCLNYIKIANKPERSYNSRFIFNLWEESFLWKKPVFWVLKYLEMVPKPMLCVRILASSLYNVEASRKKFFVILHILTNKFVFIFN